MQPPAHGAGFQAQGLGFKRRVYKAGFKHAASPGQLRALLDERYASADSMVGPHCRGEDSGGACHPTWLPAAGATRRAREGWVSWISPLPLNTSTASSADPSRSCREQRRGQHEQHGCCHVSPRSHLAGCTAQ